MRNGLHEGAGASVCPGSGAVPAAGRPRRSTGGAGRSRTDEPSDGGGASPALAGAISRLGFRLPPAAYRRAQRPGAPVPTRVLVALALVLGAFGTLFGSHGSAHAQTATVSVADAEGNENTGVVFTITLHASATTTPTVTVRYRTSNFVGATAVQAPIHSSEPGGHCSTRSDGMQVQDGASVADYEYTTGTVVFEEGSPDGATETVRVPVCPGRPFPEEGRSFGFEFLEVTGASCETSASCTEVGDKAIGTILPLDDDPIEASVAADAATVTEGGSAEFTVTLTGATSTASVVVTYSVTGTATAGTDYTAPIGSLTIAAGDSTGTIPIPTLTDGVLDPGETLTVTLDGASTTAGTATVDATAASATTTIADPGMVMVSVAPASAAEGEAVEFTVTLSGAVASDVALAWSTADGTATTAGDDYTAVTSGTLTIATGGTTGTLTVSTEEDPLAEADETFTVTMTGTTLPSGVTLGTATATGTIEDDDPIEASVAADAATATEGGSAEFTVTLSGATSTAAVVVTYSVTGTASSGTDYTAPATLMLTLAAGAKTGTISIPTLTDGVLDPGETLTVTLDGASTTAGTATVDATAASATTMIADPGMVMVSVAPASAAEGEAVEFTVTLSGAVASDVALAWSTADGTATTAGDDYTAVTSGTLTIAPGGTTGTLTVSTEEDPLAEADETFTVTMTGTTLPSGVTLGTATATGTIEDDDPIEASVAADAATATEGGSAEFTVTLSGATSTAAVVVTYSVTGTASSGTDYTAPATLMLTLAAGAKTGTISIPTLTDGVLDPGETLTVTLDGASTTAGTATVDATAASATTMIADPGMVMVSVAPASAAEGEAVEFTVTLSGAVASDVALAWSTADGTATTAGDDYTAVTSGTLTIAPGGTTGTLTVSTEEDPLAEADETFTVTMTGTTLPSGVTLGTATATGTIEDDDPIEASVAADAATATEGGSAEFTVTLSGATSTAAVVVTYSVTGTASSGTDYTAPATLMLTLAAGAKTGTISIPTLTDGVLDPGETLTVTLDGASTTAGTATVDATAASATTMIADPGMVMVSVAPASAAEGEAVEFTVTLSGAVASDVALAWSTADGTATTAGDDYTAVTSGTLTIAPGGTTGTLTVSTEEDPLAEADETFTVTMTGTTLPSGVTLGTATATGTIEDDDPIEASVAADAATATEGGSAEFTVTLSGATSTAAVVVTYSVTGTASSGTDYTAPATLMLTLAAGAKTGTISIPTLTDGVLDPGETLTVTLDGASTTAGTATVDATAASATTTIADPGMVMVSVAPASAAEGEAVEFTVTLSGAVASDVALAWSTADGTATTAGDDYTAVTSGTLTIAPGGTTGTLTVSTEEDPLAEADETFTVTMTGTTLPSGVTLGTATATATGTIIDDDMARVSVPDVLEVTEGASATVTVSLSGAVSSAVTVEWSTSDGTATSGSDYTSGSGTVTFPAESIAPQTIEVMTSGDDLAEAAKTFTVTLTASGLPAGVSLGTATTTLTIIDDDTLGVMVDPTSVTVTEGDASASYAVKLATEPTSEVTVMVHGANADVSVSPRSLTFTASNWAQPQTVTVEAVSDSVAEPEERVTLTHTVSGGGYDGVTAAPVSVKVVNKDVGAVAGWLVRAGRTVASQAVDAVTGRLDGGGESYVTLGGNRLVGSPGAALDRGAGDGRMRSVGRELPLTERELLLGSEFHIRSGAGGPGHAAFATWGRIASDRFEAKVNGLALDGEVRTSFLGADLSADRWLAGAAVAFSKGEGGYGLAGEGGDTTVVSRLTSLFPYAQVRLGERISAWGLVGRGTGKLTLNEGSGTEANRYATDIELRMGAAGVRGTLATAPGGIGLGLRSDVFWMRTSSDPIEEVGIASSEQKANRLRLVLDASRPFEVGDGTTLTPSLEVGIRHDGGDAETGRGVEVGAGLRYAGTGFRIEGTVRGLALHDESAYEEWGASGSVRIEPGGAGRGLSLTLAPVWGNPSSAARRLWSARDAADLAPPRDIEAGRRLDAEVGYGLRSPSGPGVVTPYAAISVGESAGRTLRTGTRWRLAPDTTLGLEASRAGSPGGDDGPVNALTLRAAVRW